jgi:hypothetical protein
MLGRSTLRRQSALRTPIQAIPIPEGLELDKGFAFREASGERWSLAQGGP